MHASRDQFLRLDIAKRVLVGGSDCASIDPGGGAQAHQVDSSLSSAAGDG